MRLTIRSRLALRTLMLCAANPERILRKSEVAKALGASENHLAQVVNQLGRSGFLTTLRGRHGGFVLARPAGAISVGALLRRFEADLPFLACLTDETACTQKATCRMSAPLSRAVEAFYAALDPVMLAELVQDSDALGTLLTLPDAMEPGIGPGRCVAA